MDARYIFELRLRRSTDKAPGRGGGRDGQGQVRLDRDFLMLLACGPLLTPHA